MWPFTRRTPPITTGRVLDPAELRAAGATVQGDSAYSEVNSAWLKAYDQFRAAIFREGVTKWDARFDCDDFAAFYISLAKIKFFSATFHASTRAQTLALAECYYMHSPITAHAVVFALTDRGPLYIEPQTGQELTLTQAQIASRFLVKF